MMLKIHYYPHKDLKQKLPEVSDINAQVLAEVQQLFTTLYGLGGWGLAANQVGLTSKIFVLDISEEQNRPMCFINPEIISQESEVESEEDCLSFPGIYIKISRARSIVLSYQDEQGVAHSQTFEGLMACCLQHGVDMLNGIHFIDHLSKLKRDRAMKKYEQVKAQYLAQACGHGCGHDHHH
jgi:peptide deformylase